MECDLVIIDGSLGTAVVPWKELRRVGKCKCICVELSICVLYIDKLGGALAVVSSEVGAWLVEILNFSLK
uniref:Uncharacterized protein n=1 Tax=Physcomitrium patens TaxID=3218 RepID=A0A2K1JUC1_PHYPA|nr:hypothetical protein PHYPA_014890 [Physcomitrium patens]